MKKLITICAAALAFAVIAADTDCGALITTGNIADSARIENLTGANAGKATVTINNNSGTANSVTVYNAATMDTALSGKASTGSVEALEARATALETATNNLTTAVAAAASAASDASTAATTAYQNATNNAAQTYVKKTGDTIEGGTLSVIKTSGDGDRIKNSTEIDYDSIEIVDDEDNDDLRLQFWVREIILKEKNKADRKFTYPSASGCFATSNDITNTVPAWARASSKPSYNFSELGNKPTTIAGYGITDAKIENGTITLGNNIITPLTGYTETDPVWTVDKPSYSTTAQMNTAITAATNGLAKASALSGYVPTSRKVAGMSLTDDITLKSLSIVGSSTTTYNGSATASVNQSTLTEAAKTSGGTSGKTLTLAVASTSRSLGEYYISIGSDGKPHLMLRQ
jgi:hypothetical protein